MNVAEQLDKAMQAVCPIYGVSIGRKDDKATWRIDFKKEATKAEQDAAKEVLKSFVPSADPAPPTLADQICALPPDQLLKIKKAVEGS